MKAAIFLAVWVATVAVTWAAPAEEPIPIIKQESEVNVDGSFHSAYETGNGILVSQDGVLKNPGVENLEAEEIRGAYSYTSPEGEKIQVSYLANENGFQPIVGEHQVVGAGLG